MSGLVSFRWTADLDYTTPDGGVGTSAQSGSATLPDAPDSVLAQQVADSVATRIPPGATVVGTQHITITRGEGKA